MRKLFNVTKSFFTAIGTVSSLITILWAFFPSNLSALVDNFWCFILLTFAPAFAYAIYVNRNKKQIQLSLTNKVKVKIFYGDLFESDGIIVIPFNEYFDTIVDEKIISSKTIHGAFIQRFFGESEAELKEQIRSGLLSYEPLETNEGRKSGNKEKYKLGTVCEVKSGSKVFYLLALTRFNSNHRAGVKNSEYQKILCDLFCYIEQNSQGRKVSVPLIGGGHSGVNLPKQKLLEFLLFSIVLQDGLTLANGLDVVLSESMKSDVDLSLTEILFKSIGN